MDKDIIESLNKQIWLENHSSSFYLNLSIEFADRGYNGISNFFLNQSNEERTHMLKIIKYLLDMDQKPLLPQYNFIEPFNEGFEILSHFENSLKQEKEISQNISNIVKISRDKNDTMTENFIQWFISEQIEEETKFKDIIDKIKIIGNSGLGIYEIDKELGKINYGTT